MEAAGAVAAAAWSAARGWLTPAVLFVAMNLVIATIAVASRLMPAPPGGDGDEAAGERRGFLLRSPSLLAVDRLRSSFSFSRLGLLNPDHAQVVGTSASLSSDNDDGTPDTEPSLQQQPQPQQPAAEAERQREEARVERSRSEAAGLAEAQAPTNNRRPRARARSAAAEELDGRAHGEEAAVVEVDARADDFIRRFREQLRLQRLDSILRYRDRESLRRTGTA